MAAPRSQKAEYRPIGFLLQDLGNRANDLSWVRFTIRPEDLSIIEPSRAAVQQTLGGAWLDNFGPGVKQVNISGHTGWRARYGDEDGFAIFKRLNDTVFRFWHQKRANSIDAGRDPDFVQLVFVDELDERVYIVAPMSFALRRNKSRPLLMQYQISLLVLSDFAEVDTSILLADAIQGLNGPVSASSLDEIAEGGQQITPENPEPPKSVVDSLRDSVAKLQGLAEGIDATVDRTIGQPAKAFMDKTNAVLAVTTETVAGIQGAVDTSTESLIQTAGALAQAGRNINHTIASIQSLPGSVKARFMEVSAAYGNAFCVLRNAFKGARYYPDYTNLYGSSYCSSTAGGSPLSPLRNENPFYRVSPVSAASPVTVSADGQLALASLTGMDVLTSEPDTDLMGRVAAVADGVSVQEAA